MTTRDSAIDRDGQDGRTHQGSHNTERAKRATLVLVGAGEIAFRVTAKPQIEQNIIFSQKGQKEQKE